MTTSPYSVPTRTLTTYLHHILICSSAEQHNIPLVIEVRCHGLEITKCYQNTLTGLPPPQPPPHKHKHLQSSGCPLSWSQVGVLPVSRRQSAGLHAVSGTRYLSGGCLKVAVKTVGDLLHSFARPTGRASYMLDYNTCFCQDYIINFN